MRFAAKLCTAGSLAPKFLAPKFLDPSFLAHSFLKPSFLGPRLFRAVKRFGLWAVFVGGLSGQGRPRFEAFGCENRRIL